MNSKPYSNCENARRDSRTLTAAEVAKVRERIVKKLKEEVGAVLRGYKRDTGYLQRYPVSLSHYATIRRMSAPAEPSTDNLQRGSAVAHAIAFGIDITLLIENLRLTPTERVQRAQQMLDSVVALQAEARAWRERQVRKT